jgi:K(+)-stimulated pyrophosphate-energized sodium pump
MNITLFDVFRTGVGSPFEKGALIAILVVAIFGLLYAAFLTRQILRESEGTDKMKRLSMAIRTGGNAYLRRQFRTIILIFFVLAVLYSLPAILRLSHQNMETRTG